MIGSAYHFLYVATMRKALLKKDSMLKCYQQVAGEPLETLSNNG